ncbi:hypothetical protein Tco_1323325 [Tanacetum coccineum]
MDAMLENGPWFIRNALLILKKWTPYANLLKEDVCNVVVWIKFHDVLITTFSKDGLSAIASKLITPLMLNSNTSIMCTKSWGRSSYAIAMIELQVDAELKDTIAVAVPKLIGEGFFICTIRVEYDWKPPRCSSCKVGLKLGFKPTKQVYQHVSKNNGANTSGKKKQVGLTRQYVSNSNPFYALDSIENDDDLVTNWGFNIGGEGGQCWHSLFCSHDFI